MLPTELVTAWLDRRIAAGVSNLTLAHYRNALRAFSNFLGGRPVSTVALDDIISYKRHLRERYAASSFKTRFDLAVSLIRFAQEIGELERWPIPQEIRKTKAAPPFRRVFTHDEILRMLDHADATMRACIMLGLNLGYGNHDCGRLRADHIAGSIIDMSRMKTGAERRGWAWPETLDALERSGLPLRHRKGGPIVGPGGDYLGPRFRRLLEGCGIAQARRGFYSLRRTYRTAVDTHPDAPAIDLTMGHTTPGMGRRYVAWISDERLREVSVHARLSVFGSERNLVSATTVPAAPVPSVSGAVGTASALVSSAELLVELGSGYEGPTGAFVPMPASGPVLDTFDQNPPRLVGGIRRLLVPLGKRVPAQFLLLERHHAASLRRQLS